MLFVKRNPKDKLPNTLDKIWYCTVCGDFQCGKYNINDKVFKPDEYSQTSSDSKPDDVLYWLEEIK